MYLIKSRAYPLTIKVSDSKKCFAQNEDGRESIDLEIKLITLVKKGIIVKTTLTENYMKPFCVIAYEW